MDSLLTSLPTAPSTPPQQHDHEHGQKPPNSFHPNSTVAVIGAGISGVCAAAHLLQQGLHVTVFERSSIAGGVWHYDPRTAPDPPYPNSVPSKGDHFYDYGYYRGGEPGSGSGYGDDDRGHEEEVDEAWDIATETPFFDGEVHFSPPGPCYAGLKNNVPTHLMASSLETWPEDTEAFINQRYIEEYVQKLAKNHGVDEATQFHTRVDDVRKTPDGRKWQIRSVSLEKGAEGGNKQQQQQQQQRQPRLTEQTALFDLVVVASGHYNMPRIPPTPGLDTWKAHYPDRITHSKQYRSPEPYRGKHVLVIGASVSAMDICRELDGVAAHITQSVRGGKFDLPASLLPESVVRVGAIAEFTLPQDLSTTHSSNPLPPKAPIPGHVRLLDQPQDTSSSSSSSNNIPPIHHVILATGYITSYPFLHHLHSDTSPAHTAAGTHLVVTAEGEMAHNLHRDIFYIPDPTLTFIGVPYYVATFSLFDFQAQALARVFAGKARLPDHAQMRAEYDKRVEEKGLGRGFHSLQAPGLEVAYVQELVDWVNADGAAAGEPLMRAHGEEWKRGYEELKAKMTGFLKSGRGGGVDSGDVKS
ncbi:uncharacterized protein C8A04DRAFT_9343 [Dichotomopilus funicola]|uniref:Flavin-containing monooxygenase n=1 Tax=Dichotomopilus funicola TaxID=1934379 RepID=A0AAN6VA94_9PEZI|nr:hypothetical protein C8A04DRAFT_9343 [Dichotomopilus funicola]